MKREKAINCVLAFSFVFYAVFVIWNILFKYASPIELFSEKRYFSRSINLIPFGDLLCGNYLKLDVWGNILLFAPLGVYLGIYTPKKPYVNLMTAVSASVFLEIMQYVFGLGATDITDVIYNAFGFVSGSAVYYSAAKLIKDRIRTKMFFAVSAGAVMTAVSAVTVLLYVNN